VKEFKPGLVELHRERRKAYDRVWYGPKGKAHPAVDWKQDARALEYVLHPSGYSKFPKRKLAMPCRGICEMDLHRVHTTCMLACDLTKIHSGQMPSKVPVYAYTLWIHKDRRFEPVKAALMKLLMTVFEVLAH
jgi:hypothetical protein